MKYFLIAFGILSLLFFTGCDTPPSNFQGENERTSNDQTKNNENPQGFFGRLDAFNEPYKKSLFATGQEKTDVATKTNTQALQIWENLESEFKDHQPQRLKKTENWTATMTQIGDYVREADQLIASGKLKEAHEALEQVRKEIRAFREENDIPHISDYMLAFHDTMEAVVEHKGEKDFVQLQTLETQLQPIKNWESLQNNDEFRAKIQKLETIVQNLQELEGEAYQAELSELKPAFIQAYLQFG